MKNLQAITVKHKKAGYKQCVYFVVICILVRERDINTHTFKCKCLNNLHKDTQETSNACFWKGNG